MADWNSFCKQVEKTATKAVKKTGEIADMTAKYVKLKTIDGKIAKKFEELGRYTYKQLKNNESQADKIAELIDEIDILKADKKALEAEIEADKARRAEEKAKQKAQAATEKAEKKAEEAKAAAAEAEQVRENAENK